MKRHPLISDIKPLLLCLLSLLFLFGMQHVIRFLSDFSISFLSFSSFRSCQRGRWGFSLFYTLFLSHLSVERSVLDFFFILFFCILHNCTLFLFFLFFLVYERQLPVLSISVSDSSTLFCWTLPQDPYYFLFVVSSYHINTLFSKLSAV